MYAGHGVLWKHEHYARYSGNLSCVAQLAVLGHNKTQIARELGIDVSRSRKRCLDVNPWIF
jgi:hypothetical protein